MTLITVDQAVSSGSNFLITILAAHALGVSSFGLFAIVFLTYVTLQGVGRALTGEPLLVHPEEAAARVRDVLGTALTVGATFGAAVLAAGLVLVGLGSGIGRPLVVLAVCLPMLFVQDVGRYLAFAQHRPRRALVLDLTWLVLLVVTVGLLLVADRSGLTLFVACWAGSGALAGLGTLLQHRLAAIRPGLAWLRSTWRFSWRYAVSNASMQAAGLGVSVALLLVADARALAAVRGAWLLLGPYVQLQAAAMAAGVAEVSHLARPSESVPRHVRRTTLLTVSIAAANGVVLIVLPDVLGRLVLGSTWAVTSELVVPAAVLMVLLGSISGVRSALLGLRAVRTTLTLDVGTSCLTFAATVVGAVVDGAYGAFVFLAAAQAVVTAIWWTAYLRHRLPSSPLTPPTTDVAVQPSST